MPPLAHPLTHLPPPPPNPHSTPTLTPRYVSVALVVACIGIFMWEMWGNDLKFESTEINPFYGPSAEVLLRLGAKRQVRTTSARCDVV